MTAISPPCPARAWIPPPAPPLGACPVTEGQLWRKYLVLGGSSAFEVFARCLAAGPPERASACPAGYALVVQTLNEHLILHGLIYPVAPSRGRHVAVDGERARRRAGGVRRLAARVITAAHRRR